MRLIIACLFLPLSCFAQQSMNAEQFFALGLSGPEPMEKPTGEAVKFPWIDQYEFRTETSDFDLDKQEYTLRLSPSTAKIRRAQQSLYQEMKHAPDLEGQEIYCDLIFSLHSDWLSLFILNENKKLLDELALILQDKQTIYERMAGSYEFDPEKLLKLQTERSDIEIKLNKIRLDRDFLLNKYGIRDREMDFGDFITVEAVSEYLADSLLSLNGSGMVDLETAHKEQLLLKEIELEASEKKRLVDFVQVKYNGPHSDEWQERLSVGLGFQLSNSGSKKLKMQELQIEKAELARKAERNRQEKQETLRQLENKLLDDIQAYLHLQKIMEEEKEQLQQLSRRIAQKEGTSPLFLLDIEERSLSMNIKSLDQMEELLKDYLKYLQEADRMCRPGFVNYLIRTAN